MKNVTIILPVSRADFLDPIFARLELMTCDRTKTNLLVIVDGDAQLFVNVRNRVEMSKFEQRLCIQFKSKHKLKHYDLLSRRLRISDIHNEIKMHIWDCDYIFGIEDDTIFQVNTLEKLLKDYTYYPFAGIIQGVQIGRHGVNHIGAWNVDEIYEPTKITSIVEKNPDSPNRIVIEEIDAGGFYCFLTKSDNYTNHDFKPFGNNSFGPDFEYSIELRRQGMLNYIDWTLPTIHKTLKKDISLLTTEPRVTTFVKKENRWRQSHI